MHPVGRRLRAHEPYGDSCEIADNTLAKAENLGVNVLSEENF
jgi:hypothetical protein